MKIRKKQNKQDLQCKNLSTRVDSSSRMPQQLELIENTNQKRRVVDVFVNGNNSTKKKGSKKSRGKKPKVSDLEIIVRKVEHRAQSGDWDGATGQSFVGLYALCHRVVYKTLPAELTDRIFMSRWSRVAGKILHEWFADNTNEFAAFIKWSWEQIQEKEKWALRKGINLPRMKISVQFSRQLYTDYQVFLSKK